MDKKKILMQEFVRVLSSADRWEVWASKKRYPRSLVLVFSRNEHEARQSYLNLRADKKYLTVELRTALGEIIKKKKDGSELVALRLVGISYL